MMPPSKIESVFRMPILSKSSRTLFFNKFLVFSRACSLEQPRILLRQASGTKTTGASSEIFNSWNEQSTQSIDRMELHVMMR